MVRPRASAELLMLDGGGGRDRSERVAGPTLLWTSRGEAASTLRLEGVTSRSEALKIAKSGRVSSTVEHQAVPASFLSPPGPGTVSPALSAEPALTVSAPAKSPWLLKSGRGESGTWAARSGVPEVNRREPRRRIGRSL